MRDRSMTPFTRNKIYLMNVKPRGLKKKETHNFDYALYHRSFLLELFWQLLNQVICLNGARMQYFSFEVFLRNANLTDE